MTKRKGSRAANGAVCKTVGNASFAGASPAPSTIAWDEGYDYRDKPPLIDRLMIKLADWLLMKAFINRHEREHAWWHQRADKRLYADVLLNRLFDGLPKPQGKAPSGARRISPRRMSIWS